MSETLQSNGRLGKVVVSLLAVAIFVHLQLFQNEFLYRTESSISQVSACSKEVSSNTHEVENQSQEQPHSFLRLSQSFEKKGDADVDKRAIFAISMGKSAAESKMVERFVWSARNRGNFTGPIVLLTDAPPTRYTTLGEWTGNFIVMTPFFEDYFVQFKHRDMPFKRFKTYVLEYLSMDPRLDSVDLVYYLDIDIVFGSPLQTLFDNVETMYNIWGSNSTKATMWMFRNKLPEYRIQGGQMILDRRKSQPCLDRWRWYMDSNPNIQKDQVFLNKMFDEQTEESSECEIVSMIHKGSISFPDRKQIEALGGEKIVANGTLSGTEYRPLIHIKNTGQSSESNDNCYRAFVQDVLGFTGDDDDLLGISEKMVMD